MQKVKCQEFKMKMSDENSEMKVKLIKSQKVKKSNAGSKID